MAKSLITPLQRKVDDLKEGLCILSYIQRDMIFCKETEKLCCVENEPKDCPAIKDDGAMHRRVYGRPLPVKKSRSATGEA